MYDDLPEGNYESSLHREPGSTSKLESFAPAELIACEACLRANPPTRSACIYCGAQLSKTSAEATRAAVTTPAIATQEIQCLVLSAKQLNHVTESATTELAALLDLDRPGLASALIAGGPLPLCTASTAAQAANLTGEMRKLGFDVAVIPEEALTAHASSLTTIRGLEFADNSIVLLPKNSVEQRFSWADLILAVAGRLVTNRVEVEEKRRRRSAKPIDSRELSVDESLLDLYMKSSAGTWRISPNSFDFSCLGTQKGITGFENFTTLINVIRERAPNVEIDESYNRKRAILANVWPIEKTNKTEWRHAGRSKFNLATVTTSDNESQFTRYSQLVRCLRLGDLENLE